MVRILASLVTAVAVAHPVGAGQAILASKPASGSGVVEVVNVAGSVTVIAWGRNEVRVEGSLGKGAERLDFQTGPQRTIVRVVMPRSCRGCEGSDLTVRVPKESSLEVEVVSASVTVEDVLGTCTLKSVSGEVHLRGDAAKVEARSVSGDVSVRTGRACVRASSVSGNVEVEGIEGSVEASSVSGSLEVRGNVISRAALSTTSGSIWLEGSLAPGGRVEAKSVSGDITLSLPAGTAGDFEVTTFSGEIRNALGPSARRVSRYTSEKELTFSTGRGGARIELHSFSGNVTLQPR